MSTGNLDFEQFRVFLEKACGILLGENKQYLVSSRLNKLMEQQGIKSLGELVQRIQTQPRSGLREMVVDAMTTNETLWFRGSLEEQGVARSDQGGPRPALADLVGGVLVGSGTVFAVDVDR